VRWTQKSTSRADAVELSRLIGVCPTVASILRNLGIADAEAAALFLTPRLQKIEDPFAISHMDEAVTRLLKAMREGKSIAVFGDYDVDGVTSTAFLIDFLRRFGLNIRFFLPRRMDEGYGLSIPAIKRMIEQGKPDLLIAADCGTNSVEELKFLSDNGTDVIILDHHTSRGKSLSSQTAILVNPHLLDGEDKPWSNLCTAGLVFKFAHAILKKLRAQGDETAADIDLREYLDLVALGTIADLVPLSGENRILASKGLERLRKTSRTGLMAMYSIVGIEPDQPITPFDISFRLSPRINASGRLSDACTAVEMLLSNDMTSCVKAAQSLDEMNRSRQNIEREIAKEATEMVESHYADDPALVLYDKNWHTGVVGIVASRIAGHFHRPAIVLGSEGNGLLKGSGRSAGGIDMMEILAACSQHLVTWGGHPQAVGVSVEAAKLDDFRAVFCENVAARHTKAVEARTIEIACKVSPDELSDLLFEEIDKLGPFGQGNPQPILAICATNITSPVTTFGSGHCRFSIDAGTRTMQCVAWRTGDNLPPSDTPLDLAAILTWNVWKGRRFPQLQIEDWRPHEEGFMPDGAEQARPFSQAAGRKLR
jgi:single-stranded-DNA-specific exonuclease